MIEQPIQFGIKHPHRIRSEIVPNYDSINFSYDVHLHFDGSDGSSLTVILSPQQVEALMRMESRDPGKMARDLYVSGRIELAEFEQRVERSARGSLWGRS